MFDYILVMLGGALGTGARFWASGFVAEKAGELFPLGTLVVNVWDPSLLGSLPHLRIRKGCFLCHRGFVNSS